MVWTSRCGGHPGAYYENDRVTRTHKLATDEDLARQLWDRSAAMVGLG